MKIPGAVLSLWGFHGSRGPKGSYDVIRTLSSFPTSWVLFPPLLASLLNRLFHYDSKMASQQLTATHYWETAISSEKKVPLLHWLQKKSLGELWLAHVESYVHFQGKYSINQPRSRHTSAWSPVIDSSWAEVEWVGMRLGVREIDVSSQKRKMLAEKN